MKTPEPSLKQRIIRAFSWTLFSYGLGQVFRVIGNIVVTRFLPPSDFGVIQLVITFVQGLLMLSDIGITPNIIQHKGGETTEFLRTAWTLQFLRGLLLWLFTFVIAWPLASIYQAPEMIWLLPLNGICLFVGGMASTNLALLNRHLRMNILSSIELIANILGITAMIFCAWHWRSVWTLLVAPLVSTTVQTLLSHLSVTGKPMWFEWHKESVHELIHFGKWIFMSSVLAFINSRTDRIILGLYLSKTQLGLYGIAIGIVSLFNDLISTLSHRILIPLYAHMREYVLEDRRSKIEKIRFFIQLLSIPALSAFVVWGQSIIDIIYPHSYSGAGWMLRILAVGGIFKTIVATISPIFLSMGDSYRGMLMQFIQAVLLVILMLLGHDLGGIVGMILGIVLTEAAIYPFIVPMLKRHEAWFLRFDCLSVLFSFMLIFFMYTIPKLLHFL